jgi:hypothetical protein
VGDHVVELAGDPGPFRRGGDLRLRVALGLEPGCPVLQAGVVRPPNTQAISDGPANMIEPTAIASSTLSWPGIHRATATAEPTRQMARPVTEIRRGV